MAAVAEVDVSNTVANVKQRRRYLESWLETVVTTMKEPIPNSRPRIGAAEPTPMMGQIATEGTNTETRDEVMVNDRIQGRVISVT